MTDRDRVFRHTCGNRWRVRHDGRLQFQAVGEDTWADTKTTLADLLSLGDDITAELPWHVTHVQSPTTYTPHPDDPPAVFLAGGIPACPNWRVDALAHFATGDTPVVVLNPRQPDFPIGDPAAGVDQVRWEHHHLHLPGVLRVFWFPACDPTETVQPSTLVELGVALGEGWPTVVGIDPRYPLPSVVRLQCSVARPGFTVHSRLEDVLNEATEVVRVMATARRIWPHVSNWFARLHTELEPS